MNEAPLSRPEIWRQRLKRIRALLRRGLPFVSGALVVIVALFVYHALTPAPHQITLGEVNDAIMQAMASATPPPSFSARVYPVIQPSLVYVETQLSSQGSQSASALGSDLLVSDHVRAAAASASVASGVIIDTNGDILTSLHIVAGAPVIELTFADGTKSSAEIVGAQPENDIAVLQARQPPQKLVPATLGNPNALRIGDEAYVAGSPFGLVNSMSSGVISGLERSYDLPDGSTMEHLIQVDAAVNPGNTGGPLLNRDGQVVGIVSQILNPTGQSVFIGIAFAVPITTAGGAAGLPPD